MKLINLHAFVHMPVCMHECVHLCIYTHIIVLVNKNLFVAPSLIILGNVKERIVVFGDIWSKYTSTGKLIIKS
jgi:hypothetical protein